MDNEICKGQDAEEQPENEKAVTAWIKTHKKQLILAGISITTLIGVMLGIKNREELMSLWASLEASIKKAPRSISETASTVQSSTFAPELPSTTRTYTRPQSSFDVSQHVRTMSGGRKHSLSKAAEAAAMGVQLQPNQTLVDTYVKGGTAA